MKETHIKQIMPTNLKIYRNDHEEKFSELILGFALIVVYERNDYECKHETTEQILPFTNLSVLTEGDFYDSSMIQDTDFNSISITENPLFEIVNVIGNNSYFYRDKKKGDANVL